ncbi:pyridoxal phosphate enzyme, YggS family protein [Besnoitia besnoiti]|uniref:Pyridoxal phosphate homeostasis protein n=1 Tax=Besnoitia besnoiti TaxID=94643 RepID=A0A2A9MKW1_BESBE|nr:pyridoxal phosphate enzyme, YggS family protein [Besnoitia besnoiti]PFH36267.1 pyridoxal phosphate enzyme, YggS family protein [Besnoitia besnoiti]
MEGASPSLEAIQTNLARVRRDIFAVAAASFTQTSAAEGDAVSSLPSAASSAASSASSAAAPWLTRHAGVRLLAVSKYHPSASVETAARAGQRHFGENYVQELAEKAKLLSHLNLKWHMIGHLQSNKAKALLAACPSLYAVETVDSKKLAKVLNEAVGAVLSQRGNKPLRVFLQVNTSDEDSKSGLRLGAADDAYADGVSGAANSDVRELVEFIIDACPNLRFSGLMTVGHPDPAKTGASFEQLARLRDALLQLPRVREIFESARQAADEKHASAAAQSGAGDDSSCGWEEIPAEGQGSALDDNEQDEDRDNVFELSMGMSGDLEEAIRHGSTEVRIGTAIFGSRPAVKASA